MNEGGNTLEAYQWLPTRQELDRQPYLPYEPDQQLLLPAALQEWLPDDHLAYFISDVVDQLDMSKVTARYERERRGGPPYHPRMMVKVLLYGYCVGVASSRRIAQRLHEDIAFSRLLNKGVHVRNRRFKSLEPGSCWRKLCRSHGAFSPFGFADRPSWGTGHR